MKIIINPCAGKRNVQNTAADIADRLCKNGVETDVFYTSGETDAYKEALKLQKGEYSCVVAVGGDGTVNEVIRGVVDEKSNIPIAILSAGTVNDFASYLGLPKNADKFCRMILDGNAVNADVGVCNGTVFANVVAGGSFSEVAYSVHPEKKKRLGKMAYYLNGLRKFPSMVHSSVALTYEFDGKLIEEDTFLFLISNSSSVGGFRKISPDASVFDGKLDVCIFGKLNFLKALRVFFKLKSGTHTDLEGVKYFQTDRIKIYPSDGKINVPLDFDGEQIEALPAQIECVCGAINLILPADNIFVKI